jgi:glucokinase
MSKAQAIGIDIGGTNLRVSLVSRSGEIIRKIKEPSSKDVVNTLFHSIESLMSDEVAGIGIGVAGLVDSANGRIFISPNLPVIEGIPIASMINDRFSVPVFLENDANTAAIGEKWIGAGKDFANFFLFTLGTGIGGGIIHNRKLLGVPAEIGHMTIEANGEKCPCGNSGCLESYASARAILSKAISALEKGRESPLKNCYGGNFYKLTTEDIYRFSLDGDSLARETLRDAGRYLGIGIANIINLMWPEAIILTGGLAGAWSIYVQEAIKEASRRAFRELFETVKIIPSSLIDDAGIIGAAGLVFEEAE